MGFFFMRNSLALKKAPAKKQGQKGYNETPVGSYGGLITFPARGKVR
ncbi:hypothetical protein JOC54_000209 [Alkalihalobacillus xiaoxiensis]|uniref:Uncharacterized protein n=1 Tax=Shouchella xiaoxiensis TaxID=766895 RepID=A0ABS2SN82_9BACI|nr:hypothetical protein [Shouchella xiaoxiensis]